SRVLILNRGEIIAADTAANLEKRLSLDAGVVAEIAAPAAALQQAVRDLPDVAQSEIEPMDGEFQRLMLTPRAGADLRPAVFDMARAEGWRLRELTRRHHSLEEIFVHLTRTRKEAE
ncbi:MAG: ABC transporter ATP-binding protein, partial [Verrucomicrobiae bacterium]|nr:ABC transporter ATP-binding protein [Verrucomicrobiae bacterium]